VAVAVSPPSPPDHPGRHSFPTRRSSDLVQVDTAWVARLRAILGLAERIVDLASGLLGLAVAIVVGNTIRLEIQNRSVEIEVTKRSEEHTSELQSRENLVCRLLLEKKNKE